MRSSQEYTLNPCQQIKVSKGFTIYYVRFVMEVVRKKETPK